MMDRVPDERGGAGNIVLIGLHEPVKSLTEAHVATADLCHIDMGQPLSSATCTGCTRSCRQRMNCPVRIAATLAWRMIV